MIRRTFLKGAAAVSFSLMVSPALTAFAKDSVRVYLGGPNLHHEQEQRGSRSHRGEGVRLFWQWAIRPRSWLLPVQVPP